MSKREAPPAVGGSSLLVIFAVLCLTIFSLLSLSTVQADRRLAKVSQTAVQNFYAADTEAELTLAKLRQGIVPDGVISDGNTYSYQCGISDVQTLSVQVYVDENYYEILSWKVVSTAEWEEDDSLNLWDGKTE